MEIQRGDHVIALDADGDELPRRALTGSVLGHDFVVVWVCRPEEWETANREGREPEGVPWPAEDVQLSAPTGSASVNLRGEDQPHAQAALVGG